MQNYSAELYAASGQANYIKNFVKQTQTTGVKTNNKMRSGIMKFCWCTITVNNMEESLKFYEEIVGLSLNRRFAAGPGMEIAFLGVGGTEVELIFNPNHKASGNIDGISLGFEVNSVDEKIKFIKEKGLAVDSGPYQPNPHIKFFFVKDPNGVSIQFVENM
jgi:lactoylglutathione lyase